MDLSKAFDCIPHDLLIAKLNDYGLDSMYIFSYLKERKQAVRINETYSKYMNIVSGVPQGSILGPILFNVFINDIFLFIENANIHNYADDNVIQHQASSLDDLITVLENDMIVNPKKFMLLISAKRYTENLVGTPVNMKGKTILSTDSIKFLGINIDIELKFNEHIGYLCINAGQQRTHAPRARTHARTHRHTYSHTHTHTCTNARTHAHTNSHARAHTHGAGAHNISHTHTHTHTRTQFNYFYWSVYFPSFLY